MSKSKEYINQYESRNGVKMRLRNVPYSGDMIAESQYASDTPKEMKNNWKERVSNGKPVHIEIGMGKGKFIYEMAKQNPTIHYIGIEKYASVLVRAVQKVEDMGLPNLHLVLMDAGEIMEVFGEGEVDRIYLNFSDPWPKERHAKRRLPSRQFLAKYDYILKKDGVLEFKTDNKDLFAFALEEVEPAGWQIKEVSYDLHQDIEMMKGNIMTEYEEKFSAKGNPIYKYIIERK